MSTLSVETSSSGSSTATSSPTCLSQRVTVPSVTLSPSSGIVTGVPSPPPDEPPLDAGRCGSGLGLRLSAAGSGRRLGLRLLLGGRLLGCAGASLCPPPESPESARRPRPRRRSRPGRRRPRRSRPPRRRSAAAHRPRGTGISVSTLSVETSSNGSSTSTVSPSCLSQRVTVPSVTLSPRAGIWTVKAMAGRCSSSCGVTAVGGRRAQLWVCSGLPARARWASPNASFWVGWAWTSAATSSACASQL